MKKEFPIYRTKGTAFIEKNLSDKEKKVLNDFLTFCRTTAGEYKVQCRKSEILQVRDIIEKPFSDWTNKDIDGFLAILNADSRKPWTKKCLLITLQMFIKWKFKNWSSKFNELDTLKKLKKKLTTDNSERYNEKTLPKPEEIDKMIRGADSIRDKTYVAMLGEAGLPAAVQLNIKWDDMKIDSPEDGITTLTYKRTKNNKTFVFPFGKTTTYYIKQWKQEFMYPNLRKDDYIFPSPHDRSKPLAQGTTWHMLKRLAKKAGIDKNIYQYAIRHQVLSDRYDDFTEEVHRKLYGHVPGSKQTKTYSHKDDETKTLKIALEKLHHVEKINKEQLPYVKREIQKINKRLDNIDKLSKSIAKTVGFKIK